jgi:hypothetical protein
LDQEEEGSVIPLYGFLQGDTLGLLILVDPEAPTRTLAEQLVAAASVRVKVEPPVHVVFEGRVVDPRVTVARAGMKPLDRFEVVREVLP